MVCHNAHVPDRSVVPLLLSTFSYPAGHPLGGQSGVSMGYAIDHEEGLVLFDTGIGTGIGSAAVDAYGPDVRDVREALHDAGLDPAAVRLIVNCHLHFDHCGQNRSFPGVPMVVQRREREAARATGYTVPEWVDFPEARYELVDGEGELLPGLRVIPTPGHTPGHQSAILETREGLVLLAGQAVQDRAEWESGVPADALVEQRASYERLRALRPIRVFFGHDAAPWQRS
jgi:N-acyl homoserine lactone hydrolase